MDRRGYPILRIEFQNVELRRKHEYIQGRTYQDDYGRKVTVPNSMIMGKCDGLYASEIASFLGVIFISTTNPNTEVINHVINNLQIKHIGEKITDYAYHTKIYKGTDVDLIKEELEYESLVISKEQKIYEYAGVKFRLIQNIEIIEY